MQLRSFFKNPFWQDAINHPGTDDRVMITVFIFYERHWDTVTRHMAANLASEIAFLIDGLPAPSPKQVDSVVPKVGNFSIFSQFDPPRAWSKNHSAARTYLNMLQRS